MGTNNVINKNNNNNNMVILISIKMTINQKLIEKNKQIFVYFLIISYCLRFGVNSLHFKW